MLAALLAAAMPAPVAADVVTPPRDTCQVGGPIGDLTFDVDYRPRGRADCAERLPAGAALLTASVEWQPADIPVLVQLVRNRRGYAIHLASMLTDRRYRQPCWARFAIGSGASARRLSAELDRRFRTWVETCAPLATFGRDEARRLFALQRAHIARALGRLAGLPDGFVRLDDYDTLAVGSFLPRQAPQALLDAIADVCELRGDRPRLGSDGRIAWRYDGREPYAPDGTRPAGSCVQAQIEHLSAVRGS